MHERQDEDRCARKPQETQGDTSQEKNQKSQKSQKKKKQQQL